MADGNGDNGNGNGKNDIAFLKVGRKFILAMGMVATSITIAAIACFKGLPYEPWIELAKWVCIVYLGANAGVAAVDAFKNGK